MIELKDLLEENETIVTFHLCNEYWSRNAITVKRSDDISGALEMTLHGTVILTVFFMELFLIIFYIMLGNKIGTTGFIVMSALQVFTCLWSFGVNLSEVKTAFSCNIEDIKFHRFQFLFNVVLDYIYYPWAIYMLLK